MFNPTYFAPIPREHRLGPERRWQFFESQMFHIPIGLNLVFERPDECPTDMNIVLAV